jgi:hypothetical protein
LTKLNSRRILDNLGSESLFDIHSLFFEVEVDIMDNLISPIDFHQMSGYPHDIAAVDVWTTSGRHSLRIIINNIIIDY